MSTRKTFAYGAIAAQVLFVLGFAVVGAIERHGYSAARHDVSDLRALTAHHAPLMLTAVAVSGVLTAVFALGALAPTLGIPSAVLVALSLPSLDNAGDAVSRLDCRAADVGAR